MKAEESLRSQDRAALEKAIRRTAGWAALRRIHRFIAEEEAAERSVRRFALPLAAVLLAVLALAVLRLIGP